MLLGHIAAGPVGEVKALPAPSDLRGLMDRGWYRVMESFPGAWQRNVEVSLDNVTTHPAVFACVTLIANDISKMRMRLVQDRNGDDIWSEAQNPAFSPVLRKPNHFQDSIQFYQSWVFSKQLYGNTYVLLVRDKRNIVVDEFVLDPTRVKPLVSPRGDVFYQLGRDDLSLLPDEGGYVVPASEIAHDRHNCLFHPLVGLSPIYACGLAAVQGLNIQSNQTAFFGAGSMPGGILTAPGFIHQDTADRLKKEFNTRFSGENAGKIAVAGDGLKFERLPMSAVDSQLIDQLKWSNEIICSVFHVPAYMVGLGPPPNYNNVEALNQQYYSQCLQVLIESTERCQDDALGLTSGDIAAQRFGTEFNIEDLLRMDSATMMNTLDKGRNYLTPNEGRQKLNLAPVAGGDVVYRQQQDFSLEALTKRDNSDDPFSKETAASPEPAPTAPEALSPTSEDDEKDFAGLLLAKAYTEGLYEPVALR